MLNEQIITSLLEAEAKALATTGPHGVNVVPVSVIDVEDNAIFLYDFFMGKTVENLSQSPTVSLTAWSALEGVQVKATATYITAGDRFIAAGDIMRERFPDRTLRGVIELTPTMVYDISADVVKSGKLLVSDGRE